MLPPIGAILRNLNDRQREAVTRTSGPVLVIAGPGSGKTRALAHRIAYLIASGVPAGSILAVTFTNRAAGEMRQRVGQLLGAHRQSSPDAVLSAIRYPLSAPFIGTFHGFAASLLRQEVRRIGYRPNFTIYDEDDRLALIRELVKELNLAADRFAPALIAAVISDLKADLTAADEYEGQGSDDRFNRTIAAVYRAYQARLRTANALDFDDLLFFAVRLLKSHPSVLRRWQDRFSHLHVDEYQDTSPAQYELLRLLAERHRNIFAIGDDAQCLPPGILIDTLKGKKPIERMTASDQVISAAGFGKAILSKVLRVHRREGNEPLIHITTETNKRLTLTAGHMVFAKLTVDPNIYYVYLMERTDKGFRIGHTRGVRGGTRNGMRVLVNGLHIRANQEAADKIWILKTVRTREEAVLHEQLFAFKYGVPTTVFYDKGRNISLSQKSIDFLFSAIDSRAGARQIFKDLRLSPGHPHHRPKGVTRAVAHAPVRHRTVIDVCYFGGSQPSERYPWHDHRIALVSASPALQETLRSGPWSVRSAKVGSNSWRIETARKDYRECREFVQRLAVTGNLEIHEKARLAKTKGNFDLMPASHLRPGMIIPIRAGKEIREDAIAAVTEEYYEGPLYDLSIENTHNYSANDIIVHNSIYSWRRADYRTILNFERDWPEAKIVLLEENYRSTPEILAAANHLISRNRDQKPKRLWTKNPPGARPEVRAHEQERAEAAFVAGELLNLCRGSLRPSECAVLYRVNAQSRALEEAMLERNIPYIIVGAVRFFERREIKDLLAYLRYLENPDDRLALKRMVNVPARGIGPKTFLAHLAGHSTRLGPRERAKLERFDKTMEQLRREMVQHPLSSFLRFLIKHTGYETYLAGLGRDGETRLENVRELVSLARRYDALPVGEAVSRLLEDSALASEPDDPRGGKDRVRLMTLHSAKGLEFGAVFLTGLEEGLLPHAKSLAAGRAALEEERRLAYVGMTRAKERLYLTWAVSRTLFGEIQVNMPSRFLREIPADALDADGREPDDLLVTTDEYA